MPNTIINKVTNRIDSYRQDVIDMQRQITAIPALSPVNGGLGESKKAAKIQEILKSLNHDSIKNIIAPDERLENNGRPNIIFRWKGKSSEKTIWIMAHMDIVPPGDLADWDTDPYTVIEKDGKLYGRGTEDNQQAIISAILAIKGLQDEGLLPAYDVALAFVADEETGSEYGIKHIIKEFPNMFTSNDLIYIPDAGDPDGVLIEVAEKSILWIKTTIKGRPTHGSTPECGANAHKAGAHLIVKMDELYQIFDKNDPLYNPPISTFEPTQKEINVLNVNTIPGQDIFYFDCRILPDYSIDTIKDQIRIWANEIEVKFGVKITFSYPQEETAPPATPADTPAANALKLAIKEVMNKEARTIGIGGGTVAAVFRHNGLPAVCWCTLDDTLHAPNEYSVIANAINDAKVFAHIFMQENDE
ncbi:M20 family metallo-hydrolase [bacterium]|nr:M20 family metallo-hydrolase [bacterium]